MNLFLIILLAATLPTYQDFRRIDRVRRQTGQRVTDDWLRASQVDPALILRITAEHPELLWGAAELLKDWPQRRALFERALAATGTNAGIAVRFACAAAKQGDDVALLWLRESQRRDNDNTAPWIAELWWLRQHDQPLSTANPPVASTSTFRDYSVEASRARLRLLEAAGYSPYVARRLGLAPDSPVLSMARDLARPPLNEATDVLLIETSKALQRQQQFLLSELIGQTIERSLLMMRPDAENSAVVGRRATELDKRRDQLTALLADVERNTVDYATESQMVQYFDDVLDRGEETAMKRLAETVRGKPAAP